MKQRQDELADLRGQIEYQVRAAFLDIRTAADQVAVAQSNLDLANQTLAQARDRFTAGVGDNIEVVQAQESVASANDSLISALYASQSRQSRFGARIGRSRAGNSTFDRGEIRWLNCEREKLRAGEGLVEPWRSLVLVPVVLTAGDSLWTYFNAYETTDDAQVDGHINAISARISGNVVAVLAEDEQYVKAGDVLVRIDPKDYEVALAKAEADLADAEAALESSRTDVPITHTNTSSQLKTASSSRVDADSASERRAAPVRGRTGASGIRSGSGARGRSQPDQGQRRWRRYKLLVDKDEIPRQQYDTAVSVAAAAQAALDARTAAVREAEQNIVVAQSAVDQAKARIAQADASIESALTAPSRWPSARRARNPRWRRSRSGRRCWSRPGST